MSVIVTPSLRSNTTRPRLANPAGMVVARCHARRVRRSAGVRRIVMEVLRPLAIEKPLRRVPTTALLHEAHRRMAVGRAWGRLAYADLLAQIWPSAGTS